MRKAADNAALTKMAVFLCVGLGALVLGMEAQGGGSAVPQKLVGTWSRNVTQANWNKYGQGQSGFPVGVWTMVIKKGGGVDFYTPGGFFPSCTSCIPDFTTRFSAAGARLTVSPVPVCPTTKGVYGWKVSGRALTLRVIADKQCGPRNALYAGVWKRR